MDEPVDESGGGGHWDGYGVGDGGGGGDGNCIGDGDGHDAPHLQPNNAALGHVVERVAPVPIPYSLRRSREKFHETLGKL